MILLQQRGSFQAVDKVGQFEVSATLPSASLAARAALASSSFFLCLVDRPSPRFTVTVSLINETPKLSLIQSLLIPEDTLLHFSPSANETIQHPTGDIRAARL